MDEKAHTKGVSSDDDRERWEIEEIQDIHCTYRQFGVHRLAYYRQVDPPRRFPSEADFVIKKGEDGLSSHWEKYATPRTVFINIALSFKYNQPGVYKDWRQFEVFRFEVSHIRKLSQGLLVLHDPIFNRPEIKGMPNNRAHCLLKHNLSEDDYTEIRSKLSKFCQDVPESHMKFDKDSIESEVDELRRM